MKYAEYDIENTNVEVYNSIWGKEAILLNGKKISEKYSFFGADHYFTINENRYMIRPYCSFSKYGISFKIHKNGYPIHVNNIGACG